MLSSNIKPFNCSWHFLKSHNLAHFLHQQSHYSPSLVSEWHHWSNPFPTCLPLCYEGRARRLPHGAAQHLRDGGRSLDAAGHAARRPWGEPRGWTSGDAALSFASAAQLPMGATRCCRWPTAWAKMYTARYSYMWNYVIMSNYVEFFFCTNCLHRFLDFEVCNSLLGVPTSGLRCVDPASGDRWVQP